MTGSREPMPPRGCLIMILEIVLALAVKTLSNYANHLFHESGHDFAAAWLERQLAGKPMPNAPTGDVASQARPSGGTDADAPGYVAWIRNQFPAAHTPPMNAQASSL